MNNVTLKMTDLFTGESVERTIDATNAMSTNYPAWTMGSEEAQRANLERWIAERGNEQHDTALQLDSWSFA